jgi:hypothetical protein
MKFKKTSKTPFHRYAFSKRSNVCIFAAMLTQKEVYKILVERNTFSRPKIEALIAAVGRDSAVVACIEHLGPYHL